VTATLNDVARLAGVSKSTVSNVIRGVEPVAQDTRSRVQEAINVLGYRPNAVARALRERTTQILGMVVPQLDNPFYAQLALGAERRARAEGFGVMIADTACDAELERRQADALIGRRVDGVLVAGERQGSALHDRLLDAGLPVVVAFGGLTHERRLGVVDADEEKAMADVVDHLYGLGHRRFAFVRHDLPEIGSERRARSFRAAVERLGGTLVGLDAGPTAVAAHNDILAIDLIDRIERQGLAVPADISVVGFDDIPQAGHRRIDLTTVRSDAVAQGERAAALLIGAARSGRPATGRVLQPLELVVRGSTGPVRRAA
jgi:DNA-binding LacI/PurR family transcriptional regulator